MDKLIDELKIHLKILKNNSLENHYLINVIKFFSKSTWHELLQFSNYRKVDLLCFFFKKEINQRENYKRKLRFPGINSTNFLNACIEEYIKGRKCGINTICDNPIKSIFWINLESFFETIIENIETKKEIFPLIFLLLESNRFDKVKKIYINNKHSKEIKFLISNFYSRFLPQNHQTLLEGILRKNPKKRIFNRNWYSYKLAYYSEDLYLPDSEYSEYITFLCENPFIVIDKKIKLNSFEKLNYFSKLRSLNTRNVIHNLSLTGLIGNNVFWVKKSKRVFQTLFMNIVLGKLNHEIITFKQNVKIETKLISLGKDKQWSFHFKNQTVANFEKLAILFGSIILNLNNQENSFLEDTGLFSKISVWGKYLYGVAFSSLNTTGKNFYKFLPEILEKKSISDFLKGGIIFGLSLNLKKNHDLERIFYEQCLSILRSEEIPSEETLFVRYGTCLSIGAVFSGKIVDPEKSEIANELFILLGNDWKEKTLSQGASIGLGLLFLGSNSIFLLEYFLEMIILKNYWSDSPLPTNPIIILTSIAFIFSRNKNFCNYIFKHLIEEKNSLLRQGGLIIFSMGNFRNINLNNVKILLNYLSIENDDNVKFAIIFSIGFIFISQFKIIGYILMQFLNHYNPFIRLGFCFSVSLSSFGLKKIDKQISILQNLISDKIDFVSQGACISIGLLYFHSSSKKGLRKTIKILKSVIDNNGSKIKKFGAILGLSIIEVKKKKTFINVKKVYQKPEILALFLQYWTWLPNIYFGIELFID